MRQAVAFAFLTTTCWMSLQLDMAIGADRPGAVLSNNGHASDDSLSPSLQAERWVQQLGDHSFAKRQIASRRLASLGSEAVGALEAVGESSDREVRYRSSQILREIRAQERRRELAAFAADTTGRRKLTLPGWTYFSNIVGADKTSREMFVEMQKDEWQLLAALESSSEEDINHAFVARSNAIYQLDAVLRQPVSTGSIAAILLAAGDSRITPTTRTAPMINRLCSYQVAVRQEMSSGERKTQFEALISSWLRNGGSGYYGVLLARRYQLPAGLVPAAEIIEGGQQPFYRQTGILAFAQLGSEENVPQLEKLLDDQTACSTRSNPKNRKEVIYQSQVRDVALATIIHLSGEKPEDFGFTSLQRDDTTIFRTTTVGFADDKQRTVAFDKWKAFQKK